MTTFGRVLVFVAGVGACRFESPPGAVAPKPRTETEGRPDAAATAKTSFLDALATASARFYNDLSVDAIGTLFNVALRRGEDGFWQGESRHTDVSFVVGAARDGSSVSELDLVLPLGLGVTTPDLEPVFGTIEVVARSKTSSVRFPSAAPAARGASVVATTLGTKPESAPVLRIVFRRGGP